MKKAIFIFRRDLRFYDNTAFLECAKNADIIYPIFIFSPAQITNNKFKSDNSVQFLVECLKDLGKKISIFYGEDTDILTNILESTDFDSVYTNLDLTPYSIKRDGILESWCNANEIEFIGCQDYLLQEDYMKDDGEIYQIFTPYYNKAKMKEVRVPISNDKAKADIKLLKYNTISWKDVEEFYTPNDKVYVRGGRKEGLKIIKNATDFKDYNENRNILEYGTTMLSAYLKYGVLSIREVYYTFKNKLSDSNDLIKQLYWRDFYLINIYHRPDIYNSVTRPRYNKLDWSHDKDLFHKWCNGQTGFPVVDAAMTQLNTTGYMHNRGRLIVSTFLIFNLRLHWKLGEEYFAKKLIDYDIASNNGNWKWVAAIESFSNDYYKSMAVISQGKRFDKDGTYIKSWLPQLNDIPGKHLVDWEKYHMEYDMDALDYYTPCVNSKQTRIETISLYKKMKK